MSRARPDPEELFDPLVKLLGGERLLHIVPGNAPEDVRLICQDESTGQVLVRSLSGEAVPLLSCSRVISVVGKVAPAGGPDTAGPLPIQLLLCQEDGPALVVTRDGKGLDLDLGLSPRRVVPINAWRDMKAPHLLVESTAGRVFVARDLGRHGDERRVRRLDETVLPGTGGVSVVCALDLTGDGRDELVVLTEDGTLVVLDSHGRRLWDLKLKECPSPGQVLIRRLDCGKTRALVLEPEPGIVESYDQHGVLRSKTHVVYRVVDLSTMASGTVGAFVVAAVEGGVLQFIDRFGAWKHGVDLGVGKEVIGLKGIHSREKGGRDDLVVALASGHVGVLRRALVTLSSPAVPRHEGGMKAVTPIPYAGFTLLEALRDSKDLPRFGEFLRDTPGRPAMLLLGGRRTGKATLVEVLKTHDWHPPALVEAVRVDAAQEKTCAALLRTAVARLAARVPEVRPSVEGERRPQQVLREYVGRLLGKTGFERIMLAVLHVHDLRDFERGERLSFIEALKATADRHRGFRILFVSSSRLAALDRMLETHLERWTAEHPLSRLGPVAFDGYLASFAQGFYELRPDAARAVRELTGRHPYFSAAILWELQKAGVGTASAQDVQKVALAAAKTLGPYFKGLVDDLDPAERVLLAAAADGARKDVRRFTAEVLLECCPLVGHMGTPKYLKKRLDALVERWLLGRDDDGYGFESTLLAILAQTHLPPLDKLLRGEAELVFRAFPFHRASEVLRELELDAEGLSVAEPRLPDVADAAKAWRGLSEGPESPDATTRNAGKLLDPVRRVLGTSRVNHGVRSGLYVETQDLGLAGRAFPDRVSFVVRPGGPPEPGEFDALTEAVQTARGKEGQDLAFLLTADHHRRFRKHMKQKLGSNLVVLGSGELRDLLLHPDPAAYLIKDLIAPQIGVEGLIPYETRGPVSARMFYGRAHDVRRVLGGLLGRSRRGYAVHGPRRIGKTSLLRRVEEELRRTGRAFPVLIDCSTLEGDLGWAVVSRLRGRGRLFYKTQGLEACLRNVSSLKGVPVVLLLDEIDSILAAERQDNWPLINSLRQSFNQDQCGVVVAGFRDLYDELHDQGSPLYNFLEPLALQKLPDGDARKLVEEPMQELRIEFEERAAFIDRVLELSGALPSQVQLFCRRVAERLFEEGRYQATVDDVTEVLWNEGVRQSLRATFEKNTTKLEQLLCYVVWDRLPLMEKEIYEVLVRRSVQVEPDEVARACTGLWLANILARGHGGLLHPASGAMANVIGEAAKQKGGLVMQQVRKTRGK